MTVVRSAVLFGVAAVLCWVGLWWIVAVACLALLLRWIRDSGPDDPAPLTDLRRRQIDRICQRQQVRP